MSDLSASEPVLDALGEALHLLRMTGSTYVRSDMTAPWAIPLGPLPGHVSFHLVVDGRCAIDVAGHGHLVLETGDLALVPRGVAHRLASDANITVGATDVHVGRHRVTERYVVQAGGGGGDLTTLVCGAVQFDHPLGRQLIDALPPMVRIEARHDPEAGWRLAAARQVAAEVRQARPGGAFVITRLADLLVIHGIRAWLARDPASGDGWLGALRDPQIGRALTLLHRDPTREWTVASLASEVSMSRSSFAARFARMVGEAPMRYLARWRMELAASRLRDGTEVVGDVAAGRLPLGSCLQSRAQADRGPSPRCRSTGRSGSSPADSITNVQYHNAMIGGTQISFVRFRAAAVGTDLLLTMQTQV